MGRHSPLVISLSAENRKELERWQRSTSFPAGLVKRARAILLLAEGGSLTKVGQQVGMARRIVRKWATRFIKDGLVGLSDKPGRGRKPRFSPRSGHPSGQDGLRKAR